MQKAEESKIDNQTQGAEYNENFAELIGMGFPEASVKKALQLTNDRERAVELILKFEEDVAINTTANFSNPLGTIGTNFIPQLDLTNCKMVLLARQDLGMGTGKIAAQVGHAVLGAYKNIVSSKNPIDSEVLNAWEDNGQPKIVLKIKSKEELIEIEKKAREKGINTYMVCDAGRTQVEPGSITVCALGPYVSSEIDKITGHLKLL